MLGILYTLFRIFLKSKMEIGLVATGNETNE